MPHCRSRLPQGRLCVRQPQRVAHKSPLLILGDFNAPHTAWRYQTGTPNGRRVWPAAQQAGFSLLTNPTTPTRIANRDCPADAMDSHLLQLGKAKAGLEWRWQRQRWNTTFRHRLTQLNKET
ncbi:hypothetical protein HPB49_010177 [Dermacentor silvarum]|uniref:Uncharacterized protein n=1 Tax=Dermacentor silvarum TaxID=543639 RepID=A0ACB8C2Y8_DERSI|nr:hypothetical protein HPB49_010177 [Dermacentor silvarum]